MILLACHAIQKQSSAENIPNSSQENSDHNNSADNSSDTVFGRQNQIVEDLVRELTCVVSSKFFKWRQDRRCQN
ncbi:1966_t:CDS:2, partial [Rhizophagus irregularis]